jgi:hypothetical protein
MKDRASKYQPGKRKWLKMKRDYLGAGSLADTCDLVRRQLRVWACEARVASALARCPGVQMLRGACGGGVPHASGMAAL